MRWQQRLHVDVHVLRCQVTWAGPRVAGPTLSIAARRLPELAPPPASFTLAGAARSSQAPCVPRGHIWRAQVPAKRSSTHDLPEAFRAASAPQPSDLPIRTPSQFVWETGAIGLFCDAGDFA
jgi:hypothetical protein